MKGRKTSHLYWIILLSWLVLIGITLPALIQAVIRSESAGIGITTLIIISSLFIGYFWLNGMKDVIYTLYYHFYKGSWFVPALYKWPKKYGVDYRPSVVMVYCTYNDFNADSLERSLPQNYPLTRTVILDDSTKPEFIKEVDDFAALHNLEVIRRADHTGFKAGNLNNYLKTATYDYFVILDSDEIIPNNFVTRALDYFADDTSAGIVQATHVATRNRNKFMKLFAIGVDSHWPAYQSVKDVAGFLSLLGHGAMVSRACYEAVGGFPHMVAEDLCFSIEARNKGYYVSFAPDIICEEEYPVDYLAFKKRHGKWTQGNMEFIKRYTGRIIRSKMNWFEKLDIVLFTYNLPLTAFFGLYVIINVILLPLLNYHVDYPAFMLIPTVLFLFAPMLNDIITYRKTIGTLGLGWYLGHSFLLYGSMLYISLISSMKSLIGGSVFTVTPKTASRVSMGEAIRANRGELIFSGALMAVAAWLDHSILPVLLIVLPAMFSVYISTMANAKRMKALRRGRRRVRGGFSVDGSYS